MIHGRFGHLAKIACDGNYIGWYELGSSYLNLSGDYEYLDQAYYVSQEFENRGEPIFPTCKEMLDAYVVPIFLEKARRAQIPVPEHYVTNGYFEPPVIVDPVNPFMKKSRTVLKPGRSPSTTSCGDKAIARSMTRNYTYAICC